MTLFFHEIRQGKLSLIIWSAILSFMLAICVLIYPEMSAQMNQMGDMFSEMGAFSEAFGMDTVNFGEFMGYFGVECGNVLGLGGAIFAALLGISALAKEEKERTAEFLLTHPVCRRRIVTEKLASVFVRILLLNLTVAGICVLSVLLIGETADAGTVCLLFLSYLLMQWEIAAVTFGLSACICRGVLGIGIGLPMLLYFLNIFANLTEDAKVLKYVTPFGYADGSAIVSDGAIPLAYLLVGMLISLVFVILAYVKYEKKDIV